MRTSSASLFGNLAVGALLLMLSALALYWQPVLPGIPDPGWPRVTAAIITMILYVAWCALLFRTRRRRAQGSRLEAAGPSGEGIAAKRVLVVYATQTGYAEQLARQTMQSLRSGGLQAELCAVQHLDEIRLQNGYRILFVVSTTGEGDAPDSAASFASTVMNSNLRLEHLRYAVLALGDSEYVNFCGFGHTVESWLQRAGAQALFDMIEVDNGDAGALRHWQYHLGQLSGRSDLPDWQVPDYSRWRLVERRLVNPGSVGDPCFHLLLQPINASLPVWQAGDIAEIGPEQATADVDAWLSRQQLDGDAVVVVGAATERLRTIAARSSLDGAFDPMAPQQAADRLVRLPHRDYSIASIPADGGIQLLLRQWRRADGNLGLGTGWLTEYAEPGAEIAVRIRANTGFHAPPDDRPMLLIGNGTGMASLRALLRQRVMQKRHRNWLIFGERNADRDFHYGPEILRWKEAGQIERLDLAFSRDQPERIYVQNLLDRAAESVREWVAQGAAVYVCGSLEGMAPGVDSALRRILGDGQVQQLASSSRYLRDVY